MDPQLAQVVFGVLGVLFVLMAGKAARCLQTNKPYTFGIWDGGMIRMGKSLTRTGTWVKLGSASVFMLLSATILFHGLPRELQWPLVVLAAVSIFADYFFMA